MKHKEIRQLKGLDQTGGTVFPLEKVLKTISGHKYFPWKKLLAYTALVYIYLFAQELLAHRWGFWKVTDHGDWELTGC